MGFGKGTKSSFISLCHLTPAAHYGDLHHLAMHELSRQPLTKPSHLASVPPKAPRLYNQPSDTFIFIVHITNIIIYLAIPYIPVEYLKQ